MSKLMTEQGIIKSTARRRLILQLFVFASAFIALYLNPLEQMIANIRTSEGSHGLLILGVIGYLLWLKKNELSGLDQRPAVLPGIMLTFTGCFTLFAGHLTNTMVLQQMSMIPTLLGFILLIYGYSIFKAFFIPVCYLIFLTGFIDMLLWSQAIHFQRVSAKIAVFLLELTGMPVLHSNLIIDLPHISLEVARACSGVSHIVSLMALSVPLAIMSQLTPFRKCVLVVASFFIGFFANGVRIALIGIYALYNKGADLHGPNETLYVTFIFFFGMVLLIFFSHLLSRKKKKTSLGKSVEEEVHAEGSADDVSPAAETGEDRAIHIGYRYWHWVAAGLIFVVTLGLVYFYKITPVELETSFQEFQEEIGGFSGTALKHIDVRLRPFAADDELLRIYRDSSGREVKVYIGYSSMQDKSGKIFDARRGALHEQVQEVTLGESSQAPVINRTSLEIRSGLTDVYFWYVMDDRIITNQYFGKLYTFWNGLFKRRTNGAVIVLQTRNSQGEVMPFLEELVPEVMRHFGSGE